MFTLNSVFADQCPTVADASGADVQPAFVTETPVVAFGACGRSQAAVVRSTPRPPVTASSKAGARDAQP